MHHLQGVLLSALLEVLLWLKCTISDSVPHLGTLSPWSFENAPNLPYGKFWKYIKVKNLACYEYLKHMTFLKPSNYLIWVLVTNRKNHGWNIVWKDLSVVFHRESELFFTVWNTTINSWERRVKMWCVEENQRGKFSKF